MVPAFSDSGLMNASCGGRKFFATLDTESCAAPGGKLIDGRGLLTAIGIHRYLHWSKHTQLMLRPTRSCAVTGKPISVLHTHGATSLKRIHQRTTIDADLPLHRAQQ